MTLKRTILALLVVSSISVFSGIGTQVSASTPEEFDVGDLKLRVPDAPGLCRLDPNEEFDSAQTTFLKKSYQGQNLKFITAFYDCESLASLRAGIDRPVSEWVILWSMLDQSNGGPMSLPSSYSDADYISGAVATLPKIDLERLNDSVEASSNSALREMGVDSDLGISIVDGFLLGTTGRAYCFSQSMKVGVGGSLSDVISVTCQFILDRKVLHFAFYQPLEEVAQVKEIYAQAQAYLRSVRVLNRDRDPGQSDRDGIFEETDGQIGGNRSGSSEGDSGWLSRGILSGLIGGAIVLFLGRFRRKRNGSGRGSE